MLEAVVLETRIAIHVSALDRTSLNIDAVNGRSVCTPDALPDVERLQNAFDAHPNIYGNIGPALVSFTAEDGTKRTLRPDELVKRGIIEGCSDIYVSVRD